MSARLRWLALPLLAAGLIGLVSCKPEAARPTTPAGSSGPGSSAGTTSGTTASPAAARFDKPIKPTGVVKLRIITNGIAPFWEAMGKGMEAAQREIGPAQVDVSWRGPQPADHALQKQLFETTLASDVDGICVSPVQADAFAPVIDGAIDKGIPVITFDSDAEASKRLVYLGTNNYEAGRRAGEEAIRLFPNGANLCAFVGNMSAQNARDRYRGFLDAVKGHNIVMLQEPFEDDKKPDRATRNAADAITKYGSKLNGLLGLYSYDGPALINAVTQANVRSRMKILCFDGDALTLKGLESGMVDFSVVQKPYEFGRLGTKLLYLIARKGLTAALADLKPELDSLGMKLNGNIIDTGVEVVTPKTAPDFMKRMREKGLTTT